MPNYQPPAGFLTMADAQQRLGISKFTMNKLVKREQLEVYRDPRNARVRLLKEEDLERLKQPVKQGS